MHALPFQSFVEMSAKFQQLELGVFSMMGWLVRGLVFVFSLKMLAGVSFAVDSWLRSVAGSSQVLQKLNDY